MNHSADITRRRASQLLPGARRLAIGAALVALTSFTGCVRPSRAQPGDGEGERGAAPKAAAGSPAPTAHDAAPSGDGGQATKLTPKRPPNIRLTFRTVPPKKATVMWGKKRLGIIDPKTPLVVQRPRDSGPLDVVVRAENCLPVHTRAYTFTDSTMAVKVTPLDQKNTVYGYREELPPEGEGEDGASPDVSGAGGGTSGAAPPTGFPSR